MIDTPALAERLEREYGDDPEGARRHARILGDMAEAGDVATRQDIKDLRLEVGQLRAELHKSIAEVRKGTGKMAGLLVAQAAVIVAIIRFLSSGAPGARMPVRPGCRRCAMP